MDKKPWWYYLPEYILWAALGIAFVNLFMDSLVRSTAP